MKNNFTPKLNSKTEKFMPETDGQEVSGRVVYETDKAIQLKTESGKIWIPKQAIIDMDSEGDSENMTYLVQHWVKLWEKAPKKRRYN